MLTPNIVLKDAIKAVPAVKYALGIAGIAAAVAIVAGFNIDKSIAILGIVIILILMVVLALFARLVGKPNYLNVRPQLTFFTWASMLLTVATAALVITSYFWEWPRPISVLALDNMNLRVQSMLSNKRNGDYVNAELIANEILRKEPRNYYALNTKGSVNFFRGNYQEAAGYFLDALKCKPGNFTIICNLADTYVDMSAYNKAIETYNTVEPNEKNNEYWWYSFGRANLYAGNYQIALENLRLVPDGFKKGSARILEAAALLASNGGYEKASKEKLREVTQKLDAGKTIDPDYWDKIINRNWKDVEGSHSIELGILKKGGK